MDDQEYEGNQSEAQEMGATVQPPSYYTYNYFCSECSTAGAQWNTVDEANADGRSHQASSHPPAPTFSVQEVPHP